MTTLVLSDLATLVEEKRREFAARNPESARLHEEARRFLPGGHTRTILAHEPFPLRFVRGEGAALTDADGHEYIDLLGDYTAGLFGHGERRVLDAVDSALRGLASVGGVHPREAELARLMCERFGLDRVRFTNSGTEANLMAITAARPLHRAREGARLPRRLPRRRPLLLDGVAPWNAPYEFVVAPYNDLAATTALIDEHATELAAVLVEPMLGSGGCIPAAPEFLGGVFESARSVGAVCVADEVMTSRHGRSGLAALLGAEPDIRTFGKYIGGGFSFGAFGGTADTARPVRQLAAGVDPARRHVQQQRRDHGRRLRRARRALHGRRGGGPHHPRRAVPRGRRRGDRARTGFP